MQNTPKPDNREDNVEKIQHHIDMTVQNIELANELIAKIDNLKEIADLQAKNERRENALKGMRKELQDEASDREQGYQQ